MGLIDTLAERQVDASEPFLIGPAGTLAFADVAKARDSAAGIPRDFARGEVVALIGDFDGPTIALMLQLLDKGAVVMPLTEGTRTEHEYYFEAGNADWVADGGSMTRRRHDSEPHPLLEALRSRGNPGIIFFSSGTTGRPKAILHDFTHFLARYAEPRPSIRALNFLLFDHAGGINTMLHTLFNRGVIVVPSDRSPESVADDMQRHGVELLPATPTFLRMLLLSGIFETTKFPSLRVITYGTERMDQGTLDRLCHALPSVDFRQTYGLSELGVFQVRSKARDSLWMKIGGKGIETRTVDDVLHIHSGNRMLGYLNAPDPFEDGWYNTGDLVELSDGFMKIVGRATEILNVGGLKILPSEIERVALAHPGVQLAKAYGVPNPLTGQHIEVICQPREGVTLDRRELMAHFRAHLQKQLCPHRVIVGAVAVSHRFKQK